MPSSSWTSTHFQSPIFSLLIAYLFFVVGLNLSGVFEVGNRLAGVGQGLVARGGTTGAFFTGVLAVIVATPCTAPFMAAALGFALAQPAPATVAVLLAMGLGLALPYLALSMTPALQRLMPRPGPWMDRLRQLLAFPMYASAVWMIWVLTQQTGADGVLYALGGMVLIAFAIWLLRAGSTASAGTWLRRGLAAVAVLLAFGVMLKLEDRPATAASASGNATGGVNFDGWERFSRARMAEAVAAGKPVIATAFPHAVELLGSGAGIVVPHGDPVALAAAIRSTFDDPVQLTAMTREAARIAPSLSWATVARQYGRLGDDLVRSRDTLAV